MKIDGETVRTLPTDVRKLLLFGVLGAAGCLAGWMLGEGFLAVARPSKESGDAATISLVSKPELPPLPSPPIISRPAPPDLPADFAERVRQAGGRSGEVTVTLIWNNYNDLDLHCIDPRGERIFFGHRRAISGGELDIDRNAGGRQTNRPVENIRWLQAAPIGRYRVYVHHFANHRDPDPTHYRVNISSEGQQREFQGSVSPKEERFIHEFEAKSPPPALAMAIPQRMELLQGGKNSFTVLVARANFSGSVNLRLDGDLDGLTYRETSIPSGGTEAEIEVVADRLARDGNREVNVVATASTAREGSKLQLVVLKCPESPRLQWSWRMVIVTGFWTGLLAVGLSLALVMGQNRYLARPLVSPNQAAFLAAGGLGAGFAAGAVGEILLGVLTNMSVRPEAGFVAGWLLLGGLMGRGVGIFIPNLDKRRAAVAGASGALLGALVFLGVSRAATDTAGRFTGAAILGFAIGLMVALVEVAFRKIWLEITYGPREIGAVNLGPEPVSIGSDAKACTIYARNTSPIAFRYWIREGRILCSDGVGGSETEVQPGDRRTIGSVEVVVRTATASGMTPEVPNIRTPSTAASREVKSETSDASKTHESARQGRVVVSELAPSQVAPDAEKARAPSKETDDRCPGCGRKAPGARGARYCMVCDRNF